MINGHGTTIRNVKCHRIAIWCIDIGQIARIRDASVDMGIGIVRMVCIVCCTLATNKVRTTIEDILSATNI